MLPDSERLRRASVFQRAYNGRKSISSEFFILYVLPKRQNLQKEKEFKEFKLETSSEPKQTRLPLVGFVVSKKALKNATQRNHAKRRVREAYRHLRSPEQKENTADVINSLQQWYTLVWVINEKALNVNWTEICKTMKKCLSEADKKYGQHNIGSKK